MSMQLSTFKTSFEYSKARNQHWMFALYFTLEISPLHVKKDLPKCLPPVKVFNVQ